MADQRDWKDVTHKLCKQSHFAVAEPNSIGHTNTWWLQILGV